MDALESELKRPTENPTKGIIESMNRMMKLLFQNRRSGNAMRKSHTQYAAHPYQGCTAGFCVCQYK